LISFFIEGAVSRTTPEKAVVPYRKAGNNRLLCPREKSRFVTAIRKKAKYMLKTGWKISKKCAIMSKYNASIVDKKELTQGSSMKKYESK
jgi:hypothetical protein